MTSRNALILFLMALTCLANPAVSQDPKPQGEPQELTYRVQSQLVQIYLTVTEGTQRISDLKQSDFSVAEDAVAKDIDRLDSGTVPLQVALLLDTSESMREALPSTQEAAAYFVESLSVRDRVTLVPFNSDIRSIPQLSDDRAPILHAIRSTQAVGGTKLYDALLFAMKHLSGKEGRKAIVAFSDGEDTARSSSLNIVMAAAARYGFPIYSIGAGAGLRRDSLKRVMRQLADINSGKMYVVEDPRDLRDAFAEVASELSSAYVLNYYTQVPFDGRWHDVKISLSNPKYRVHCRRGFYAKAGGSSALLTDLGENERKRTFNVRDYADAPEGAAKVAATEVLKTPVSMRELEARPLRGSAPAPGQSGTQSKTPVFKVESRFVEVPVIVESPTGRELPLLTEKDFRVYEDDSLREIAFFSRDIVTQNLSQLRDKAMKKVGAPESAVTLSSDGDNVLLGRYYLVLDDMMSDVSSFLQTKTAAEKIVREFHSPLRPVSLHFTSQAQADILAQDSLEIMLQKIRKSLPRASRELTTSDNIMSVYEAYLIERGDTQATQLAELRYASSLLLRYKNDLGEVEGQEVASPEMVINSVQNTSRQLVASNFAQLTRALDGLRAVVAAATSDPGTHPKTAIFLSSGFSLGRTSARGDMAGMLDNIIAAAKRSAVKVNAIDAAGLTVDESLGIGANGAFLVRNPHLSSILAEHARSWHSDKQSPLFQMSSETGGKFVHSNNDLAAAASTVMRSSGQLYYLGYLSKQPADGRFHRIRVTSSLSTAKIHARKGYIAGRQNAPETLAATSPEGEDWEGLLVRANEARKKGDMKELAASLEQLVRRFPNESNFWFNLGAAHLNLGNPLRAVEVLQKAFALSPDDKTIALTLSQAFMASGSPDAASETLEIMARRHPRDVDLLMLLGRVYESDSRVEQAYETYRRILDLSLTPPLDLYVLLTRTSMRLGRRVEAGLFIDDFLRRGGSAGQIESWRQVLGPASQ
jgi:VWFA-related protein